MTTKRRISWLSVMILVPVIVAAVAYIGYRAYHADGVDDTAAIDRCIAATRQNIAQTTGLSDTDQALSGAAARTAILTGISARTTSLDSDAAGILLRRGLDRRTVKTVWEISGRIELSDAQNIPTETRSLTTFFCNALVLTSSEVIIYGDNVSGA